MSRKQNYGTMSQTSEIQFAGTSSTEYNTLCDNVVTNMYNINSAYKTLDAALKNIGTSRDNKGLRDNVHVTQLSTNQIIAVTSKDLRRLNLIVKKGEKQQKLQVEKLMENFTEAVEKYSVVQKQVANKMKANLLTIATIENEEVLDNDNIQQQQQIQKTREMAFEQDMLLDREVRVRQIEADILDVNEIMRELGALVHQQGETIDLIINNIEHATFALEEGLQHLKNCKKGRSLFFNNNKILASNRPFNKTENIPLIKNSIENQIDHTAGNIEEGNVQLTKAAQYQNKYRRKLAILVIVAILIAAILIGVLVSQLKKR